jgi:dUTP pyrophosphatase
MEPYQIRFEALHPSVVPPQRATDYSAGYDLAACLLHHPRIMAYTPENTLEPLTVWLDEAIRVVVVLPPRYRAIIPLGFKAQLPHDLEAQIRPRSGTSVKKGLSIANAPGTIDADYPGEWGVVVRNDSDVPVEIAHGERIAQAVLARVEPQYTFVPATVQQTTDRTGGFGSTGQ